MVERFSASRGRTREVFVACQRRAGGDSSERGGRNGGAESRSSATANRAALEPIGSADRRFGRPGDRTPRPGGIHTLSGQKQGHAHVVCQPTVRVLLEVPADTVGAIVARSGVWAHPSRRRRSRRRPRNRRLGALRGRARDLQRQLAGITRGEGVVETTFEGCEPVSGDPPTRPRTTLTRDLRRRAESVDREPAFDSHGLQAAPRFEVGT
jgi:hypothetical protein